MNINEDYAAEKKRLVEMAEVKAHRDMLGNALADLRALTKASTPRSAGQPDFALFRLPKDGQLRARGLAILDRVDRLLGHKPKA